MAKEVLITSIRNMKRWIVAMEYRYDTGEVDNVGNPVIVTEPRTLAIAKGTSKTKALASISADYKARKPVALAPGETLPAAIDAIIGTELNIS